MDQEPLSSSALEGRIVVELVSKSLLEDLVQQDARSTPSVGEDVDTLHMLLVELLHLDLFRIQQVGARVSEKVEVQILDLHLKRVESLVGYGHIAGSSSLSFEAKVKRLVLCYLSV